MENETNNNQTVNVTVTGQQLVAKTVTQNKHVFVWVWCFLLGGFGVDRFVRGQVGLGIVKLLIGPFTCGIWWLVDWIISMVKAYSNFSDTEEITFVNGKYARQEKER